MSLARYTENDVIDLIAAAMTKGAFQHKVDSHERSRYRCKGALDDTHRLEHARTASIIRRASHKRPSFTTLHPAQTLRNKAFKVLYSDAIWKERRQLSRQKMDPAVVVISLCQSKQLKLFSSVETTGMAGVLEGMPRKSCRVKILQMVGAGLWSCHA